MEQPKVTVVRKTVKHGKEKDPARYGQDPCIRAENEDDDGYDPYSDRREVSPLFEEDPWR